MEKEKLLQEKSQREKQMERMRSELEQLKKKKVDLVKKAREDQKRFTNYKKDKKSQIKTMVKADRRQEMKCRK